MSKALENQQKRLKDYSDNLKRIRAEHSRYLACLVSIDTFPGTMTVAEIKRIVHETLHPKETNDA